MDVIDGAGPYSCQEYVSSTRMALLTIITGHRSRAEKKANEVLSPVFDCAVAFLVGMWVLQETELTSLRIELHMSRSSKIINRMGTWYHERRGLKLIQNCPKKAGPLAKHIISY